MSDTPTPPYRNKFRVEASDADPKLYRYVIEEMDGREVEVSDFVYQDPNQAWVAGDKRALRHRMNRTIGSAL